ncbi:ABC transporter substrate-binding protein [Paramicrobacterium fandaimingii]|uniref:ABC transporter substrate-binding protein n=1 Tax=Paramicrobacterium fandaimingii TaxID=2708079 RepID=UPI00141E2E4B|nr:ABC transporter substrate-binding protein [Microbacterium fandaimingii]
MMFPKTITRGAVGVAVAFSALSLLAACNAVIPNDADVADVDAESTGSTLPSNIVEAGQIVIATGENTVPTHFLKDGELIGFNIDIADALEDELGVTVKLVVVPFDSLLGGIAAGRYDAGLYNVSDRADRREVVDFVDYANSGSVVVTRKGEANGISTSIASMCGHTIGVNGGGNEYSVLQNNADVCTENGEKPFTLETFQNDGATRQALLSGRIEALVDGMTATPYMVAQHEDELELAGKLEGDSAPLGMPIAKDQPKLAHALKAAWEELLGNGTYEKIAKKWSEEALVPAKITINDGEGL